MSWKRPMPVFDPSPFDAADGLTGTFACGCGRQFTSAQGLATHKRQAHQEFSLEHDLLEGATCPECLRHFWTKQRLYQHLSYVSRRTGINQCYQALRRRGFRAQQEIGGFCLMPNEVKGLGRVEALQTQGPMQPVPDRGQEDQRILQETLRGLQKELCISCKPEDPESAKGTVVYLLDHNYRRMVPRILCGWVCRRTFITAARSMACSPFPVWRRYG